MAVALAMTTTAANDDVPARMRAATDTGTKASATDTAQIPRPLDDDAAM